MLSGGPQRRALFIKDDLKSFTNCIFYKFLGILKPIGRMLSNKALMLQTVALSLLNTALFGYVNYDTASIQVPVYICFI